MTARVAVVGAGLAGLVAARALTEAGHTVVVCERETRVGGRLATRRLGGATLDSGAQFLTVREDAFGDLVDRWREEGCPVEVWCHGFAQARDIGVGPGGATSGDDGHPRHVIGGGMETLALHLAEGLDVRTGHRVTALEPVSGRWRVRVEADEPVTPVEAEAVVLTAPGDEARRLLGDAAEALPERVFVPTVALLAALDRPPDIPPPGGVQFASGPVSWLADNAAKGVSALPAITAHASEETSAALMEASDAEAEDRLRALVGPWLGGATVTAAEVERWPHAQPQRVHPERALVEDVDGATLVLAGDSFGGPRVEGAALSGIAAARALADHRA